MSDGTISHADVIWRGGTASSEVIPLSGNTLCGLYVPSGFAGTTLSLHAAYDRNMTPVAVKDETGAAISYAVTAGTYCRVKPGDVAGVANLRLVSSATEAANTVVKAAVREIE